MANVPPPEIANHDRFFVLNLLTDIAYILIRISDDATAKFCLEHIDAMRAKIINPEGIARSQREIGE